MDETSRGFNSASSGDPFGFGKTMSKSPEVIQMRPIVIFRSSWTDSVSVWSLGSNAVAPNDIEVPRKKALILN